MRDSLSRSSLNVPGRSKWLLCLGISFCALALTCWPQGLLLFRYDRDAIMSGELWRLLTGHLVHLNRLHLLLNLAGLALICELLWDRLTLRQGAGLLGFSMLIVSALLWWLHPEIAWYAGLSGALHGLWSGCALAGLRTPALPPPDSEWRTRWPLPRLVCAAALLLLAAKLGFEALHRPLASAETIGAPVISAAHWYGAWAGMLYMAIRQGKTVLDSRR